MTLPHTLTNKKKLRRIARQTSGTTGRALLTLAMAGMLACPPVGPAHAAVTSGLWDGKDLASGIKSIQGDMLLDGQVTINGALWGVGVGQDISKSDVAVTGNLNWARNSELYIKSGVSGVAQVKVNNANISKGNLFIGESMGAVPTTWRDGPMFVGGLGGGNMTLNDLMVYLEDYGQLVQAAKKNGQGGLLSMTDTAFYLKGAAAHKAGILLVEGTGDTAAKLLIGNTARVDVRPNLYGRIVGEQLYVEGGLLASTGNLLLSKGVDANTGELKGTFTAGNSLEIYNTTLNVLGGENSSTGLLHAKGQVKISMEDSNNRGSLRIGQGGKALIENTGAALNIAGGSLSIQQGGQMLVTSDTFILSDNAAITTGNPYALKIAGGTLTSTIGGVINVNGSTLITGIGATGGSLTVSEGQLSLKGDVAVMGAGTADSILSMRPWSQMTTTGNVTLSGVPGALGVVSVQGAGTGQMMQSGFNIKGNLDINAYGKVDSRAHGFVMVDGNSSLAANGAVETAVDSFFIVRGNMKAASTATINNAGSFSVDGNFVNTGATINNTNTGSMYIADTFSTPSISGAYTHSAGYAQLGVLYLTDMGSNAPVVNVTNGTLHLTGRGATLSKDKNVFAYSSTSNAAAPVMNVSGTGRLFFGGDVGGTFAHTVNMTAGSFGMGMGEWTVGSINASGGAIQAGYKRDTSTPAYGTLNVGDLSITGTATMALRTGKVNVSGNFVSNGGSITLHGGIMTVDASQVYDASQSNLLKTTVSQFVSNGGVLNIKNGATLSFDNAKKFHDALVGTNGLWSGVTVTGITPENKSLADGSSANIIASDKAAIADVNTLSQFAVGTTMSNATSATLGAAAGQIALTGTTPTGNVTLTTIDTTTIVGNGKPSDSLVLGAGDHKTTITVADAGTLNLGAAGATGGGMLNGGISNSNAKPATINVASGDFTIMGDVMLTAGSATGTLNLNEGGKLAVQGNVAASELVFASGGMSATGNVNTGTLTLAGGSLEANGAGKTITASNNMNLSENSQLTATKLNLTGATAHSIDSGSKVEVKTLTVATGSTLIIGSTGTDGGKGVLVAESVELSGVEVFLDPAWKGGDKMTDASHAAIGGSNIEGLFTVGQNSWVNFGSTDVDWLPTAFADAQLTWGKDDVTAALGIYSPQTLRGGGVMVNGTLTNLNGSKAVANHADFAAHSLLAVNALGIGSSAALTGTGTANIADGAKLLLVDGAVHETYTILSGFSGVNINAGKGWQGENLVSSIVLQSLTLDTSAGTVKVTVGQKTAEEELPEITPSWGGFLDDFIGAGLNDVNSPNAGIAFISNALSITNGLSARDVVSVVESAAQTALAGAAPSAAFDSVAVAAGATGERTGTPVSGRSASYSSGDSSYSFGVWGMPLFRSSEIRQQKSGSFKYSVDNKLYGGIIGFDVTNPLMAGDLRIGAALNIGTGDSKSRGGLSKTKNEYDFWGASVYAGYRQESVGLSADFGFNSTASNIKQDLPGTLNMGGHLTSKVDAKSYTVGLKAEYIFRTSTVDITPSIGMRYIGYHQDGYNVNSQRGTVFNMASASMDTFTFPIGVKFSRELELSNGWNMTPELNLAIVPAAGDTKLTSKARIPGVNISPASMTGHVFDGLTGEAGFGLRLIKENLSFGVNYDFQGGSHQRAHSVIGSLRYTF